MSSSQFWFVLDISSPKGTSRRWKAVDNNLMHFQLGTIHFYQVKDTMEMYYYFIYL